MLITGDGKDSRLLNTHLIHIPNTKQKTYAHYMSITQYRRGKVICEYVVNLSVKVQNKAAIIASFSSISMRKGYQLREKDQE